MPATLIDLIRHGEPQGGRAYRGHRIDDPLSELGWQQMWAAVGDTAPWSQIITSPLQRCQAFAERLAARHDIPCCVEHDFREVGFGDWEGRTPAAIQAEDPQQYADFYRDPVTLRPPGAEDLTAFITRVTAAYEHHLEQQRAGHVLIVAHAGVNRAIIAQALHCAPLGLYRIQVKPAGMSRLSHHEHGSQLLYHNCKLADMA